MAASSRATAASHLAFFIRKQALAKMFVLFNSSPFLEHSYPSLIFLLRFPILPARDSPKMRPLGHSLVLSRLRSPASEAAAGSSTQISMSPASSKKMDHRFIYPRGDRRKCFFGKGQVIYTGRHLIGGEQVLIISHE